MRFDLILISHHKNQVKPHSSPWFSAACCQIVPGNYFFRFYQQNKFSESKVKFRQASNHCKRVLEPAKNCIYANKTKESITSQKLGFQDFNQIANSVLRNGKYAIPLLFHSSEAMSSASDKAKLFPKNSSKNSNFDDPGISLRFPF